MNAMQHLIEKIDNFRPQSRGRKDEREYAVSPSPCVRCIPCVQSNKIAGKLQLSRLFCIELPKSVRSEKFRMKLAMTWSVQYLEFGTKTENTRQL